MAKAPGCRRTLFYRQPQKKMASSCSTVIVSLDDSLKKVSWESQHSFSAARERKEKASVVITLPSKTEPQVARGTQTDYRESEAQTVAWRHEVKAEEHTLQQLLSLNWLSSEEDYSVGMAEVRRIEGIRQQLAWENEIRRLRGAENEERRRLLVARTAEADAEEKGRRKAAEEEERAEMARGETRARRKEDEKKVRRWMARAYEWRRAENEAKFHYWHHQMTRQIRKMKSARSQSARNPDIIAVHLDKSSDIYASKLRDGRHPSLGHEVIDIQCRYLKRYHGLEILEKHLAKAAHSKKVSKAPSHCQSSPKKRELCLRKFKEKAVQEPNKVSFSGLSVRIPVPPPSPGERIPAVVRPLPESEEALESASLLLKRLIKGRAVQSKKFLQIFKISPM